MAEALVIRLKAAPASSSEAAQDAQATLTPSSTGAQVAALEAAMVPAEWLLFDPNGARQSDVQTGMLADAAGFAAARKVVVIVPGTDVLLAEPVLPVKSGVKLLQVVPFALEEQLATDVEDMHFAVGKREGAGPGTPVAAVARELMDRWLIALRAAGIHPEAIYAETSVLPITASGVTMLIDGTRVYVRREKSTGAVLDVEPLIEALQLGLAAGDEERENVTIYLNEDVYERERDLFEGLGEFTASLQLKLLPHGPLPLLAAKAVSGAGINLMQGSYALKTKLNVSFQPWRYAAMLAGGFLALHVGLKTWQYFDLRAAEAKLDAEITQVFQQAMPGAPVPDPATARQQVEARLAALRGGGPVGGIMTTLGTLGEAMAEAPGSNIEALSYRDQTTDLRVLASSVEALEKIRHAAAERGISAELQGTSPRDSKVEGRLQLKKPGA